MKAWIRDWLLQSPLGVRIVALYHWHVSARPNRRRAARAERLQQRFARRLTTLLKRDITASFGPGADVRASTLVAQAKRDANRWWLIIPVLLLVAGCNGGNPATSPTPLPPVTVTPPPVVVVPPVTPPVVPVTPVLPTFPPNDARFNMALYLQLVHNAYQGPLQPLRRFSQPPRIYLRTVDEDGKPIDARMLNDTARALEESAGEMTGKFGLAGIERGTDQRVGRAGWLTVRWLPQALNPQRICGQAYVGLEGGTLDLFPYQSNCGCEGYGVSPRMVRHELGHALGYWHTDDPRDLMYTPRFGTEWANWRPACNVGMSAREIYHASVAYTRPIGSPAP